MQLLLHIGYPKAASSSLQNQIFCKHSSISLIPHNAIASELMWHLYFSSDDEFKRRLDTHIVPIQRHLESLDPLVNTAILSDESFLSYSMFFHLRNRRNSNPLDFRTVADRLYLIVSRLNVDSSSVYIVVRRQLDLLKAFYAQFYNRVFSSLEQTSSFSKYLAYGISDEGAFLFDSLHFSEVYTYYRSLFSQSDIFVDTLEKANSGEPLFPYLARLLAVTPSFDITSIDSMNRENTRKLNHSTYISDDMSIYHLCNQFRVKVFGDQFGRKHRTYLRYMHPLLSSFYFKRGCLLDLSLQDAEEKAITSYFMDSNIRFNRLVPQDLDKLMYW